MAPMGDPPMCTCPKVWHGVIPPPPCSYCQARMLWPYYSPYFWPYQRWPWPTYRTHTTNNTLPLPEVEDYQI